MDAYNIFIVEDDTWYGEILEYHISLNPDNKVTRFETAKDFLDELYLQPDLVTIDFSLPDMQGDKLYQKIRENQKFENADVLVEQMKKDIEEIKRFFIKN